MGQQRRRQDERNHHEKVSNTSFFLSHNSPSDNRVPGEDDGKPLSSNPIPLSNREVAQRRRRKRERESDEFVRYIAQTFVVLFNFLAQCTRKRRRTGNSTELPISRPLDPPSPLTDVLARTPRRNTHAVRPSVLAPFIPSITQRLPFP
jgi:hypothetical protein